MVHGAAEPGNSNAPLRHHYTHPGVVSALCTGYEQRTCQTLMSGAIEPQCRICWWVARGLAYAQAKPPWNFPETCTRMRSLVILSRARPRQGRAGSNASNSSTSLARKAAMSPTSLDSISTGRTASGAIDVDTSVGRAPLASPVPTSARLFHAATASAGVSCVGPMAPQCRFSQTTQQLPCTAWLTKTSSLPQNGQGNNSLTWKIPCT